MAKPNPNLEEVAMVTFCARARNYTRDLNAGEAERLGKEAVAMISGAPQDRIGELLQAIEFLEQSQGLVPLSHLYECAA